MMKHSAMKCPLRILLLSILVCRMCYSISSVIQQKVLICGICRDVACPLPYTIKIVENIGKLFKDYQVIVYENDSQDKTLPILKNWAEKNSKVLLKYEKVLRSELEKSIVNIKGDKRWFFHVEEIARARNLVLDIAMSKKYDEYPYIIWLDMDFKIEPDLTGMVEIFNTDKEWDAVFAYGVNRITYTYWDWYALRDDVDPLGPELLGHDWFCPKELTLTKDSPWYPVYSAFGGCGIYKKSSIVGCRYSALATKDLETVSKEIIENGKKTNHPKVLKYLRDITKLDGVVKIDKPCPNLSKITDPNVGVILNSNPNPLIWRMNSFVYQYPVTCDTVPFHASMIANGHRKLFINPRLIFIYGFDGMYGELGEII